MIIKALGYLYYRVYSWQLKKYGSPINASTNTMGIILFLLLSNYFALDSISSLIWGVHTNTSKYYTLFGYNFTRLQVDLMGLIMWFIFDKLMDDFNIYNKLQNEYSKQTSLEKLKGKRLIFIYICGSIIASVIFLCLSNYANGVGFTIVGYFKNM